MWVTTAQDAADFGLRAQTLFAAEGIGPAPIRFYLGPAGAGREDVGDRILLRFSAAGFPHRLLASERVEFWRKGERRHLVVSWDSTTGDVSAAINGKWMPLLDTSNMAKLYLKFPWQAVPSSKLLIGASDVKGKDPWQGVIEDVKVFDHPLTPEEARAEFLRRGQFRIEVRNIDAFLFAGRQERFRLVLENPSPKPVSVTPEIEGATRFNTVTIGSGQTVTVETRLRLATPGTHTLRVQLGNDTRLLEVTAIDPAARRAGTSRDSLKLIADVDATAQAPVAESAPSRIIDSPLGRYRESADKRHDRFAVGFTVRDLMQPHVAVIEYPDDKPRTMEALLQRLEAPGSLGDYQGQTGVLCGAEYPLSQRMQEHRIVFWPTAARMSFIFMTGENGRPAAVRRIRVYEQIRRRPLTADGGDKT